MSPGLLAMLSCRVVVVDRIEDDRVVLDWCGAARVDVPASALPSPVVEGAVIPRRDLSLSRRERRRGHVALVATRQSTTEGAAPSNPGAVP